MRVWITAAIAALVLGAVLVGAWTQQRRLIYFPAGDPGPAPPGWEEVTIATESGLELEAWHRSPGPGPDSTRPSMPIVVLFPGNAGNRAGRLAIGDALAARGLGVVLVDYRGFGGNPGAPSEEGLADDARSAALAVARLAPNRPVVYFGESLGTGVATRLAVEMPPAALVLASPFTSFADLGGVHYGWVPPVLIRDRYSSLEHFESGALDGIPALVVAGTADRVVPVSQSRRIAAAAGAELYEVAGAGHNDRSIRSGPEVIERIVRFIEAATAEA